MEVSNDGRPARGRGKPVLIAMPRLVDTITKTVTWRSALFATDSLSPAVAEVGYYSLSENERWILNKTIRRFRGESRRGDSYPTSGPEKRETMDCRGGKLI